MNIDKPCHNSSCEPTATGRRSKKSSRIAHGVFDHGFFWPFLLMQRDSKRICKRYRLRLLRFRLSFDMPLSCNIYCPKESKCRHLQNPSKISLVLPRYNQNQKINQKTNPCKESVASVIIRECFFDLSSVAAGLQSAMQQYYLPTIYIVEKWIRNKFTDVDRKGMLLLKFSAAKNIIFTRNYDDFIIFLRLIFCKYTM